MRETNTSRIRRGRVTGRGFAYTSVVRERKNEKKKRIAIYSATVERLKLIYKRTHVERVTLKSRRDNLLAVPAHTASAFLPTLIMYSRVLPVDHPLSVRALASCKPRQGAAARNACIWNDRASRVREVAGEEEGSERKRERGEGERDARDTGRRCRRRRRRCSRRQHNDDDDDDSSRESHLRLNFKFSPMDERFSTTEFREQRGAGAHARAR